MFQGLLIFALTGIVLVGVFVVILGRRRTYEEQDPADVLSDEEFRRIEFGDDPDIPK